MKNQLLFVVFFLISLGHLKGQCDIKIKGVYCLNNVIEFTGNLSATNHTWDMNGQGTVNNQSVVLYSFNTPGNKVIKYTCQVNGQPCTSSKTIYINPLPVIRQYQVNKNTNPCNPLDNFCIRDSSYSPSGLKMSWVQILLDDGQIVSKSKPSSPSDFCYKYRGQNKGFISTYVEIVDDSGCIKKDSFKITIAKSLIKKPAYTFSIQSSCDSSILTITDTSSMPLGDVVNTSWDWGNGTKESKIAKSNKQVYRIQGTYKVKVITTTKSGCIDTFTTSILIPFQLAGTKVKKSLDSVCPGGTINFSVDTIPKGVSQMAWIHTQPDGTEKILANVWTRDISFEQLGPQIVRLFYNNLSCSKQYQDTILVIGPKAQIEKPNYRIDERQVFQCSPKDYYRVDFVNNSNYYHNDDTMLNDDSSYYDANAKKIKHYFGGNRVSLKSSPQIRTFSNNCVERYWMFGDDYASKCTTFYYQNINKFSNCAVSTQYKPTHFYKGWDIIKLENFGVKPMLEMAFNSSTGVCFKQQVYPSDSFYLIVDTILTVPASLADSINANTPQYSAYNKHFLIGKTIQGPGQELITKPAVIQIPAGITILLADSTGKAFQSITGPLLLNLKINQIVKVTGSNSIDFILAKVPFQDSIFASYWSSYKLQHPLASIISRGNIATLSRYQSNAKINKTLYNNIFNAEIVKCYKATLIEKGTCGEVKCESRDEKLISITEPKASGYRIRPIISTNKCSASDKYMEFDFDLSYLKPGCSSPEVYVHKDSGNIKQRFVFLKGNRDNKAYQSTGSINSNFTLSYSKPFDTSGYKTIGIVISNGVNDNLSRSKCYDTFWYHNLLNFNPSGIKLRFYHPKPIGDSTQIKVCKNQEVFYHVSPLDAAYNLEDYNSHTYYFETPATGKKYNLAYQEKVSENMYWRKLLSINASNYLTNSAHLLNDPNYWHPDTLLKVLGLMKNNGIKKYYNYVVRETSIYTQALNQCGELIAPINTPAKFDTTITGFATQFDTFINSEAVSELRVKAFSLGFESDSLSERQLIKMVWNNVGVINVSATGSYGCIDTTGMGLPDFNIYKPKPGFYYHLHPRDSIVVGIDHIENGLDTLTNGVVRKTYLHSNKFLTKHNTGYSVYATSLLKGLCPRNALGQIFSGFKHIINFSDTIMCAAQVADFTFNPNIQYFYSTTPWTTGSTSHWANKNRQDDYNNGLLNREQPPIWDWHSGDNTSNPSTFNGTYPFGGKGKIASLQDNIPITRFGTPVQYYTGDTNTYVFTSITSDSSGCIDTFSQNIHIVEPRANFKTDFDVTNCRNLVAIADSSFTLEPYILAKNNCQNSRKDFIVKWVIDWGDSSQLNKYTRTQVTEAGMPKNVGHLYNYRGTKFIKLTITTNNGCENEIIKKVEIPGPKPTFKFQGTDSNIIYLCLGDTAFFRNTTLLATRASQWKWEFGDGKFNNKTDTLQGHLYSAPGRYLIQLTQYDSIFVPPNIRAYCSGTYPADTNVFKMIAIVKGPEMIKGKIDKLVLCPNQVQTFTSQSSPSYNQFYWQVTDPNGQINVLSGGNRAQVSNYSLPGQYTVVHWATINPGLPPPYCPGPPDTLSFFVDSVVADFTIDTAQSPTLCFNQTGQNGIKFHWGFIHYDDITLTGSPFKLNETTTANGICKAYEEGGDLWVCLVAENSNGCTDTICKKVFLDIYLFLANVFTPDNGDGKNDTYKFLVKGTQEYEVNIYNRWNEHVFKSQDPNYHWNGRMFNTGAQLPDGTYFYTFAYKFRGSPTRLVRGSVNIIREK
jgi:gliding motility-associated-like protein